MSGKPGCFDCVPIDASCRRVQLIALLPIVRATASEARGCKLRISPESIKRRLIPFIVAIVAASAPAGAQGWREYESPNEGFTAAFPAEPKVETTSYKASGGRLVEARV